jgi:hypothetical protein
MKNSEIKSKLRAVLKAAIWDGLIFAAFTAFGMIFSQAVYLLGGIPETQIEIFLTGKMSLNPFSGSLFLYIFCCTVINSLLGMLVCAFFAFIWQLRTGNNREIKN